MPAKINNMWLKVLIGFMITLLLAGAATKLDKDTFNRHEKYQSEQFDDVKAYLIRIEKNTKKE